MNTHSTEYACPTCKGTGRGRGPHVKAESPVAPGLMVWTRPECPSCEGTGSLIERELIDGEGARDG